MLEAGFGKLKKAIDILDFRFLKFKISKCPLHGNSVFLRLNDSMLGVRCVICGAAPIATSIAKVLIAYVPDYKYKKLYELSARGAFFEFLTKSSENVVFSEYMDDVKPGDSVNGVLCQDVQQLTFESGMFDVCTSTEVFEHVPDDIKGFKEIFRVLRDNGLFIFTVPFSIALPTNLPGFSISAKPSLKPVGAILLETGRGLSNFKEISLFSFMVS